VENAVTLKTYLHAWNAADSMVKLWIQAERGDFLCPVVLPGNVLGRDTGDKIGTETIGELSNLELKKTEFTGLSIEDEFRALQQVYLSDREHYENLGQYITSGLGDEKVEVFYTRFALPEIGDEFGKDGKILDIKILAMSDGVDKALSMEEQIAACRKRSARETTEEMMRLAAEADIDDKSLVVTQLRQEVIEEKTAPVAAEVRPRPEPTEKVPERRLRPEEVSPEPAKAPEAKPSPFAQLLGEYFVPLLPGEGEPALPVEKELAVRDLLESLTREEELPAIKRYLGQTERQLEETRRRFTKDELTLASWEVFENFIVFLDTKFKTQGKDLSTLEPEISRRIAGFMRKNFPADNEDIADLIGFFEGRG